MVLVYKVMIVLMNNRLFTLYGLACYSVCMGWRGEGGGGGGGLIDTNCCPTMGHYIIIHI